MSRTITLSNREQKLLVLQLVNILSDIEDEEIEAGKDDNGRPAKSSPQYKTWKTINRIVKKLKS